MSPKSSNNRTRGARGPRLLARGVPQLWSSLRALPSSTASDDVKISKAVRSFEIQEPRAGLQERFAREATTTVMLIPLKLLKIMAKMTDDSILDLGIGCDLPRA